jgi:hypothetical protein
MRRIALILLAATVSVTAAEAQSMDEPNAPATSAAVVVRNSGQLASALKEAEPGAEIHVAPGVYHRGVSVSGVRANAEAPILVRAFDPNEPPLFEGMKEGIKLSKCSWITLRGLRFRGCRENGVNVDDGGDEFTPSMGIVLEDLSFSDIGPRGNHDGIKLSGVRDFVIRGVHFRGWGGSAIDMVGCHNGVVELCRFEGVAGYRQKSAVQIKGGSSHVLVQRCLFRHAGERAISIGGSTGPAFFRPSSATIEARHITVAGNRFVGGEAHVAWVTSRQTEVRHNLFYRPAKWVARVLQESKDKRFRRCGAGTFTRNVLVVDSRVAVLVNVGRGTEPESFRFERNVIVPLDSETPPDSGIGGFSPIREVQLTVEDPDTDRIHVRSSDPRMEGVGPEAYVPAEVNGLKALSVPAVKAGGSSHTENPAAVGIYVVAAMGLALLIAALVYTYPLLRSKQRRRRS